jgi:hypothetical protein
MAEWFASSFRVRNALATRLLSWKPRCSTPREGLKDVVAAYQRSINEE